MVVSCCAFGCTHRKKKGDNIGMYRFPKHDLNLRERWIRAIKRKDWEPNKSSRICGKHFQTGKNASFSSKLLHIFLNK